jgi:hypothetical protein
MTSPLTSAKLPDSGEIHLWADAVELRCLVNPDMMFSKADIAACVTQETGMRQGMDDYSQDYEEPRPKDLPEDLREGVGLEDVFRHLRYRRAAFGESYPFQVSGEGDILKRQAELTEAQRLYVFLLLASSLRNIDKKAQSVFTSGFELACAEALASHLPPGSQVRIFGKNPMKPAGPYSCRLRERVRLLARELLDDFVGRDEDFHPKDTGDNGLDLVAWIPFSDGASGFLRIFGQCACSPDDWKVKQDSCDARNWRNFIKFSTTPVVMTFIPFCFRGANGRWYQSADIHDSVLMDRLRLLSLLADRADGLAFLPKDVLARILSEPSGLV